MSVPVRLSLFAAGLAVVFAGSFALGAATDADDDVPPTPAPIVHDHVGPTGSEAP